MGPDAPAPVHDRPRRPDPVEPIIWLLSALVIFFLIVLVAISKVSPNDGQTFQVVSTLVSGFSGALLARIKPASAEKPSQHIGTNAVGTQEVKPQ